MLDRVEAALEAAFEPSENARGAGWSVLRALGARGGSAQRVALQDADPPQAEPIVKAPHRTVTSWLDPLGRYQVQGEIASGGVGRVLSLSIHPMPRE